MFQITPQGRVGTAVPETMETPARVSAGKSRSLPEQLSEIVRTGKRQVEQFACAETCLQHPKPAPKHRRVATIVGVLLACCAFMAAGLWRYIGIERKFDPEAQLTHSNVPKSFVEKTGIAIIGDSWIKPELASVMSSYLTTNFNHPYEAQCFAHPGGKSRQIYRNLTRNWSTMLTDDTMKYCVVIVGVNDCDGHIGADFYTHHVIAISRLLLKSGITPVIVDAPEFDIAHTEYSNFGSRFKRPLFRILFDGGKENVICDYRNKLHQSLRTANLDKDVIVVPFDSFIDAYLNHKELYGNACHLNSLGTKELARHIAKAIEACERR